MKICVILLFILFEVPPANKMIFAQEEELINYYLMEPLDDSLFIKIQKELFIDPPDPKAEIIIDIRNSYNQVISVKGSLYPFFALMPETRSKIVTYPFKIDLEEQVNFGSVFSRIAGRIKFERIINKPTTLQISSTLGYINPYFQLMGGERFGFALIKDFGLSFGAGTPYSGPLETNYIEANLHLLGFRIGTFNSINTFTEVKGSNNHNNLFVTKGFHAAYVVPFGNFFELGYLIVTRNFSKLENRKFTLNTVNKDNIVYNSDGSIKYQPYLLKGSYFNWELRYPVRVFGATRGKFYAAKFINEWHIGYFGREHSIAGSVFDFRFDAMISSPIRQPQYVCDVIVQRIFDDWGFSSIALGPSFILSYTKDGNFGLISLFFNLRIKVGSSF